jgi:processing peptidase subunit beta
MGQPVRGSRDNVGNITSEALQQFVGSNCVGNNLVVVASGDCTEADVLGSVGGAFGGMAQSAGQLANMDKPIYTASLMFMRDDEMANMNIAVFFNAPSYTNEDYWAFTLLNKLMCEYREDRHTGMNLNAVDRQYSTWHKWLGNLPDISITKPFYFPGSDGGLWGNYLHGNEVHGAQMCFGSQNCVSEFSYEVIIFHPKKISSTKRKFSESEERPGTSF